MPLVQTRGAASAQGFGEFAQVTAVNYIEEVFSCFLYTGTSATQTITNNIDLSTKGGLTWIKGRSGATDHRLTDTARGVTKSLASNSTDAEATETTGLTAFGTTGFTIGADADYNTSAATYASWTFRKQPKFFDVVTWTGSGANRTIAHALGSVPGCIIVKRTDTTADWSVYHTSLANTEYLVLNTSAVKATGTTWWNSTTPTSSVFSVGTDATVNASGGTYVAYLFAHNAGGFGLTGTDNVISCGSFTTDGSGNATVNLGYEPQWLMTKSSSHGVNWQIGDNMRGWTTSEFRTLMPNLSNPEGSSSNPLITSTGFQMVGDNASFTFIYIAIRRGPMKVPTSGTSVFTPVTRSGTNANTTSTAGFPVDWGMTGARTGDIVKFANVARLIGNPVMFTSATNAEATSTLTYQANPFDSNTALKIGSISAATNASGDTFVDYMFRRAPSFFDEVCYTGTGVNNQAFTHNLGAVPELMIIKMRVFSSGTGFWFVYSSTLGYANYLLLNSTAASGSGGVFGNQNPDSSSFYVSNGSNINNTASQYVAYLFSSCAGVSKVGSYTGNGSTQTINCGFTGGARFVLIKRTDASGDWYVWDSARGIVSGNDPYLLLNSTAAEVTNTDYVDTYSAGFEISSTAPAAINASGGSYIFLAIA